VDLDLPRQRREQPLRVGGIGSDIEGDVRCSARWEDVLGQGERPADRMVEPGGSQVLMYGDEPVQEPVFGAGHRAATSRCPVRQTWYGKASSGRPLWVPAS